LFSVVIPTVARRTGEWFLSSSVQHYKL